jgi:hypothetical protein
VQQRKSPGHSGRAAHEPLLDDANKAIIEQLQQDGRRSLPPRWPAVVGLSEGGRAPAGPATPRCRDHANSCRDRPVTRWLQA